jgi:hypothetical protein
MPPCALAERHFFLGSSSTACLHVAIQLSTALAADNMAVLAIGAGAEASEADPVALDAVPV